MQLTKSNFIYLAIVIFSVLCICFSLCACGGTDTSSTDLPDAEELESINSVYNGLSSLDIDAFDGQTMSVIVNDDISLFPVDDLSAEIYIEYGDFDSLGRATGVIMSANKKSIHNGGLLSSVADGITGFFDGSLASNDFIPTGYIDTKYDFLDGKQLFGIGFIVPDCLDSDDYDENLITITASCRDEINNLVSDTTSYMKNTDNHIMYRFTPIFTNTNLLMDGMLIEAKSIETSEIEMCRFVYNAEPGMNIDYATGSAIVTWTEPAEETDDADTTDKDKNTKDNTSDESTDTNNDTDTNDYDDIDVPDDFTINDDDTITYTDNNGESVTMTVDDIIDGIGDTLMDAQDTINEVGNDIIEFIDKYGEEFWNMAKEVGEHGSETFG